MGDVTVLKRESLYLNGFIKILEEELPEHKISTISYVIKYKTIPDLLLVDTNVDTNALEYFKKQKVKIAVLTSGTDRERIIELLKFDLDGYFHEGMELSKAVSAIEKIFAEENYIHPYFSNILHEDYMRITQSKIERPINLLTEREWDVVENMANGYSNQEIASYLYISEKTVKNHVNSILKKLRVENRTKVLLKSIKNNWVNIYT